MYNTLVFIGRFQPFHFGHRDVIDKALDRAKEVVVVIGSSFQARSIKNPFTFEERKELILSSYGPEAQNRIKIVGVMDYPYDDNAWVSAIQSAVDGVRSRGSKVGLIGHSKDHSSYYLKIFPNWSNHVEVANVQGIDATTIRHKFYSAELSPEYIHQVMNVEMHGTLCDIILAMKKQWDWIVEEYREVQKYKELWSVAPYEPTFVTTDAVLTQSGSILLIKRGGFPFKDYWALPGGYLDTGISIEENMIKELREETCVKVPEKVLRGSIKAHQIFDLPDRDPRGRTITHGFHVDLGYPFEGLPKVKGADDAKQAKWFELSEIKSDMMAFDHYHVIKRFISTY